MTDYGPNHAAAVDRHLREQDRLADLEAAYNAKRDWLEVGDTVYTKEPFTALLDDDGQHAAYVKRGTVGEVVRCLSPYKELWLVCFPSPVFDVEVKAATVERIADSGPTEGGDHE